MQTLTAPAATSAPAVQLDDSQRVRCEVWTRVMGYHRPVSSFIHAFQACAFNRSATCPTASSGAFWCC
ncbi:hypothetical protein BMR85_011170 [Achromobacter sp. KAs 3-5]|nr:hypothetical protein BMR85_011170 [Achromobacter sp. KAs 3-5]